MTRGRVRPAAGVRTGRGAVTGDARDQAPSRRRTTGRGGPRRGAGCRLDARCGATRDGTCRTGRDGVATPGVTTDRRPLIDSSAITATVATTAVSCATSAFAAAPSPGHSPSSTSTATRTNRRASEAPRSPHATLARFTALSTSSSTRTGRNVKETSPVRQSALTDRHERGIEDARPESTRPPLRMARRLRGCRAQLPAR